MVYLGYVLILEVLLRQHLDITFRILYRLYLQDIDQEKIFWLR